MARGNRYFFGESIPISGSFRSSELDIVYVFVCTCQLDIKRMDPVNIRVKGSLILKKWVLFLSGSDDVSLFRAVNVAGTGRCAKELLEMLNESSNSSSSSSSSPLAFVALYLTRELSAGGVFSSLMHGREFRLLRRLEEAVAMWSSPSLRRFPSVGAIVINLLMWQVKASITFRDGSKVWAEMASVVRGGILLGGRLAEPI